MDTQQALRIQVIIKNVYGRETVYPACDASKLFASLAGTTTLTDRTISLIKALGYTVAVVSERSSL